MKVIDECNCPNCGKKIECQRIRRPYLKIKTIRKKGHASLITTKVRGVYRWVVSKETSQTVDSRKLGGEDGI